jgi:hypothetical protein
MNDLAVPDTLGLDEVLQPLLQRRSLERLNRLQALLHPPQYSSRLRRRAEALFEGCLVIQHVLVSDKEITWV